MSIEAKTTAGYLALTGYECDESSFSEKNLYGFVEEVSLKLKNVQKKREQIFNIEGGEAVVLKGFAVFDTFSLNFYMDSSRNLLHISFHFRENMDSNIKNFIVKIAKKRFVPNKTRINFIQLTI